jgi:16S rRNA G966 N2-methylase RsmD
LKDFAKPLPQKLLNIEDKCRSNLFSWRGQFSPQLIECLLDAYCLDTSVLLDPFAGSGTVLHEAAAMGLSAYGFEINPSAWSFSKIYEFANLPMEARNAPIHELRKQIEEAFAIRIFSGTPLSKDAVEEKITSIGNSISNHAKILCNALVVLLDFHNNLITNDFIQSKYHALTEMVRYLPYSAQPIKADLQDARCLPLQDESIDFAITSPPYINVFDYHQNYRRSVELLGWDLLRVARSEIGSNRANRGNRFCTVVQYCIDMTTALRELARVLKAGGRATVIVGYESQVLGTPFHNADIIERIATELQTFEVVLRRKRIFMNRFGNAIREDILNFVRTDWNANVTLPRNVGRRVAQETLVAVSPGVPEKNRHLLSQAIRRVNELDGTPIFNGFSYREYHTRDCVMMVKEKKES